MIYYKDMDGNVICQGKTIGEMATKTGFSRKYISGSITSTKELIKKYHGEPMKRRSAYFERDLEDYERRSIMEERFLRLYFDGKDETEISHELKLDAKTYHTLYTNLIGDDHADRKVSPGVAYPEKAKMRDGFWDEWDKVRNFLLESGVNLKIPIVIGK